MTEDEMKDLIRSLSCDERNALRCFATYGIDEWDKKTTINKKPFVCPSCGGTGLLEVLDHVIEKWTAEDMSLLGDGEYGIHESRQSYHEGLGDLCFECVGCERPFYVEELEKMFEVTADEDDGPRAGRKSLGDRARCRKLALRSEDPLTDGQ